MKHGKGWTEEKIEHLRRISRTCKGSISTEDQAEVTRLLRLGRMAEARSLANELRSGCGQDINALILAGPCDGEVREYACPGCGNKGSYRAYVAKKVGIWQSETIATGSGRGA
jgi:hypothetical protein